jgi:hypothetical protein
MHPTRPLADASIAVAISNWIVNYGPGFVTVLGGLIGAAYYIYLIYDKWDERRNRPKPRRRKR